VSEESDRIKSFLEALSYQDRAPLRSEKIEDKERYPFVTISRQTGAGGHTLAQSLLDHMNQSESAAIFKGWKVFDRELVDILAKDPKLHVSLSSLLSAEYHSWLEDFLSQLVFGASSQDAVLRKMFKIIHQLARVGKVILIGRGGSCVTRRLPSGFHIRLVASHEKRVQRMTDLLHTDGKKAARYIAEQDAARRALVRKSFGADIADPLLYDAVFNTDTLSMHDMSRLVIQMIRRRAAALSADQESASLAPLT
jgi:cytidylate kinase